MTALNLGFASDKDKFYTFHTSELPTPIREAVQVLPQGTKVFLRTHLNEQIVGHVTRIGKKGPMKGKMKDVYLEDILPVTRLIQVKSIRFALNGVEVFATI